MAKKLKIKMVRGMAKASRRQEKVLESLGIKKSQQVVEHYDSATIMGMLKKVSHMVEVQEAA